MLLRFNHYQHQLKCVIFFKELSILARKFPPDGANPFFLPMATELQKENRIQP